MIDLETKLSSLIHQINNLNKKDARKPEVGKVFLGSKTFLELTTPGEVVNAEERVLVLFRFGIKLFHIPTLKKNQVVILDTEDNIIESFEV